VVNTNTTDTLLPSENLNITKNSFFLELDRDVFMLIDNDLNSESNCETYTKMTLCEAWWPPRLHMQLIMELTETAFLIHSKVFSCCTLALFLLHVQQDSMHSYFAKNLHTLAIVGCMSVSSPTWYCAHSLYGG
jgi:hypothetical protein